MAWVVSLVENEVLAGSLYSAAGALPRKTFSCTEPIGTEPVVTLLIPTKLLPSHATAVELREAGPPARDEGLQHARAEQPCQ